MINKIPEKEKNETKEEFEKKKNKDIIQIYSSFLKKKRVHP